MKRTILLAFALLSLIGCKKGKEFAVNEKIANEFLKEMNSLDEFHNKFLKDTAVINRPASTDS